MPAITGALLTCGVIFPMISLITVLLSAYDNSRNGKNSSPVLIPLVGPILLICWVLVAKRPLWWIPICVVTDLGTLAFTIVLPRLVREWWRTSSFTRILALHAREGIQAGRLTLHTTGAYLLEKSWSRRPGDSGVVALGETGTFTASDDEFELRAHYGRRRTLRRVDGGAYVVEDAAEEGAAADNYSLDGWRFAP